MKSERWASPYVSACKILVKHRATTPFVSTDRYDHKLACKHTQLVPVTHRKNFSNTQTQVSLSQKHIFLDSQKYSGAYFHVTVWESIMPQCALTCNSRPRITSIRHKDLSHVRTQYVRSCIGNKATIALLLTICSDLAMYKRFLSHALLTEVT